MKVALGIFSSNDSCMGVAVALDSCRDLFVFVYTPAYIIKTAAIITKLALGLASPSSALWSVTEDPKKVKKRGWRKRRRPLDALRTRSHTSFL